MSTSLESVPDHRITDTVSNTDPGGSSVASSTHDSGDAPVAIEMGDEPVVGAGAGVELLLLGGVLFGLFLPGALPLLPWPAAGIATASAIRTLAATTESRRRYLTGLHPCS
jgi:hypothetical protein